MKISVIFGTRPEAIKLAPVIMALIKKFRVEVDVCVTAQHRKMLDETLAVFGITPDTDLDLMRPGQTLAQLTIRAVLALDGYLGKYKPDAILVQGDTTTVLCGALTAFYHKIKIGHVEAGLRTYQKYAPFPEEANRVLTSHLADWHFAPTETARQSLLKEGIADSKIFVTGNTVIDALYMVREKAKTKEFDEFPELKSLHSTFDIGHSTMVLITGHRRESFGGGFEQICGGIKKIAQKFPEIQVVYPVHLNPNVQQPVKKILGGLKNVP
ncbi:UDP-N-acetylglucosamine 2-epimerase (non-hydrolyzing) [candidate division TA06 bacterium]|uniref:UDP-N-acetylglucosamine 2-epimerase (non-hydrolyzing) n=1 Tax=candidate division TA06 bacterium TaxID=2250710 RepID=A0A933MJE4_UNCT6|nr:UDP-N-acetylglucosamine 2-epimerase (non-hydrolyzing) [candidate division TA06 bacterium]